MGTPCLVILHDWRETEIAVVYRHYDGYPEATGQELVDYLVTARYNDPNCLAANVVRFLKTHHSDGEERGYSHNIYLYPPGTRDMGEYYKYFIYVNKEGPLIKMVDKRGYILFNGRPENFNFNAIKAGS